MSDEEYVRVEGDQAVEGHKHFEGLAFFEERYSDELPVGVFAKFGVASPYYVPPEPGQGIILEGRRFNGDYAGSVIVRSRTWRTGAFAFAVNHPLPIDLMTFGVADNGDVHFGQSVTPEGVSSEAGSLVNTS